MARISGSPRSSTATVTPHMLVTATAMMFFVGTPESCSTCLMQVLMARPPFRRIVLGAASGQEEDLAGHGGARGYVSLPVNQAGLRAAGAQVDDKDMLVLILGHVWTPVGSWMRVNSRHYRSLMYIRIYKRE